MLTRLSLKNFTVFPDANFLFAEGLNLIVGENGAGKSHALKAAYTVAAVSAWGQRDSGSTIPTKGHLESAIAKKLRGVFRPDTLGRLARRQRGVQRCEVEARFKLRSIRLGFSFTTKSVSEVVVETLPTQWEGEPPVFLPTRELLTIYPGFVSLYDTTQLKFEETWRDTCLLLGAPLQRGRKLEAITESLKPLEAILGGKVVLGDNDNFYIRTDTGGETESHLVSEGLRKLAMIARLIATGSLVGTGSLFWDEPDANLNPKIVRQVARTILHLCRSGIQVFAATHSLFLMRELDILLKGEFQEVPAKFFGLSPGPSGVSILQGESVDEIGPIAALDEELSQSDRYLQSGGK